MADITLPSGFKFDYTNLYGEGKVTDLDLKELMPRLYKAHAAVTHMRAVGEVQGHLSKDGSPEKVLFSQLPYIQQENLNSPASIDRLKQFGRSLRNRAQAVVSLGIGGSFLGNRVMFDVHCGEFWNMKTSEERQGYPELYFSGNNIDARHTAELIGYLKNKAEKYVEIANKPYTVTLIVISKSGSTLDTMSNFMVIYQALQLDAHINSEVVVVTDPAEGAGETLLHRLARENGWRTFSVPDGVGGRFSIFSEVGLVTAAAIGFDIEGFLAGARDMDQVCQSKELWQNPAMLNAALKYLAAEKYGRDIEVFMPYADNLKSTAEWYIQLLAESLGKRRDRDGREVFYGRTPLAALGTTDMHSQTQQHQDGKKDKVVQFVCINEWPQDIIIPDGFPQVSPLSAISGIPMSKALYAAYEANAEALSADNRFNAAFIIPKLTPYYLGGLLYLLCLSVAYEGELAHVDAFDQPGVEGYKRLLGPRLAKIRGSF